MGEVADPAKPVIEAKERVDDLLTEVEHLLKAVNRPVFHGFITNQKVDDPLRRLILPLPAMRARHYSRRTEEAYIQWIKRFIFFHDKRHPASMGGEEINAFLS